MISVRALRRRKHRPSDEWHLNEVFILINDEQKYLWRGRPGRCGARHSCPAASKHQSCQTVPPLATQGFVVHAEGARDRYAGQLPGGVPRDADLDRAPPVEESQAENSHEPTRQRERNGSYLRSPASQGTSSCLGTCCRHLIGSTRRPPASRCETKSPRAQPLPEQRTQSTISELR